MALPFLVFSFLAVFVGTLLGQDVPPSFDDGALLGEIDAPRPFIAVRAFPEFTFRNPVECVSEPGSPRLHLLEVDGRILSFLPGETEWRQVIDLRDHVSDFQHVYGMAFHPRFLENRLVYLCYTLEGVRPDGSVVVECSLDSQHGQLRWDTHRVVLRWMSGGHNGGCLRFGPDNFLYISAGDGSGPNPPDTLGAGQDCGNLLATIMRIDVDRRDPGLAYAIPPDNPFSDTAGVRPEIWAYGFRNPWKMAFDHQTGALWVGDVGWDTWELIYRVARGGNYGWSIMEGRQPIAVNGIRGPTPILPPFYEHSHAEARSITGGYVYTGKRFPELQGAYVYGDYETGKIWTLRERQGLLLGVEEIADTPYRIITFGQSHEGELYVVDYAGGIYTLERAMTDDTQPPVAAMPRLLSETDLFSHLPQQEPANGLIPYHINHSRWTDGLEAQRWIAFSSGGRARVESTRVRLPERTVLVKTLRTPRGNPVETQVLQRHQGLWRAFSYAWDAEGHDAHLVPPQGMRRQVDMGDGHRLEWRFVSATECLVCHHHHVGVLGLRSWQLPPDTVAQLTKIGMLESGRRGRRAPRARPSADPVRAYLDVNCAPCHRPNGGGLVPMDLRLERRLEDMAAVDVPPQRGDFHIREARVIAPGRPEKSTLYYRMATAGSGHMPHLGSQVVDRERLRQIHDWIASMDPTADRSLTADEIVSRSLRTLHDQGPEALPAPDASLPLVRDLVLAHRPPEMVPPSPAPDEGLLDPEAILALEGDPVRGRALLEGARGALCLSCHRHGTLGRAVGPPLHHLAGRRTPAQLLQSLLAPSHEIAHAYVLHTVRTTLGESHRGFIRHHDRHHLTLQTLDAASLDIPIQALETWTASDLSAMPAGLASAFSPQEIADLLAFLSEPGG